MVPFFLLGCADFGVGGTGERVVPRERLRVIEPFNLAEVATTQASTQPSTKPAATTQATSVDVSIERVRQLAIQNNLDLKVELFSPTIAKQALSEEEARFELLFTTEPISRPHRS